MSAIIDDNTLNDCGCCEVADLDHPAHYNRPGQDALVYRLGTHATFLRRMLANLTRDQLPVEEGPEVNVANRRPLSEFTTRSSDDPAIGIMDAWAVAADVLTFYQERIANEGYLRTATERRSVLELADAISYELNPGVAASTVLAFTAEEAPGSPESVTVPVGIQVQSIPGQDELPQTFETVEEIIARADWNVIPPYTPIISATDTLKGATALRLDGLGTGLEPGDVILVVGPQRVSDPFSDQWDFSVVQAVETFADDDYTQITLELALIGDYTPQPGDIGEPIVYALRQGAFIFGYNAADWQSLASTIKADYLPSGPKTAISTDGQTAVSGDIDGSLTVWTLDVATGAWLEGDTLNSSNPTHTITSVAITSDGQKIISGNAGGYVSLWTLDLGTWTESHLPATGAAHSGQVTDVAFSNDDNEAWSHDSNNLAKYWNLGTPTPTLIETNTFSNVVSAGGTTAVGNADGTITVYVSGSVSATLESSDAAHTGAITRVAVAGNGKKIISGNADGFVKTWINVSGNTWTEFHLPAIGVPAHTGVVTGVALSTDTGTTRALSEDEDAGKKLILWDVSDLNLPAGAYLSTDGQTAVVDNPDGSLTTWNLDTALGFWEADKTFSTAASAAGTTVAGNADGTLTVSGERAAVLTSSDPAHTGAITSVTISSDGLKIISGNADGFVKAWTYDLINSEWDESHPGGVGVAAHTGAVTRVALPTDKTQALSRDAGNKLILWNLDTAAKVTEFSGSLIFSGIYFVNQFLSSTPDNVTEWPNFDLALGVSNPSFLDLDNAYTGITPESWVALQMQSGTAALYQINSVNPTWQTGFGLDARVTQLELETPSGEVTFDRRTTTVFARSESLALFVDQIPQTFPIEGNEIELDRLAPNLETERVLVVSGKRMHARMTAEAGVDGLTLKSADGFFTAALLEEDELTVMSPPVVLPQGDIPVTWVMQNNSFTAVVNDPSADPTAPPEIQWHLRDRNGFTGYVTTKTVATGNGEFQDNFIILEPPAEDDEVVSEVTAIENLFESEDRKRTKIILNDPLENIYDHDSVGINANVAQATHGETTAGEVLGGGNGASINQQFALNKTPLTYVAAPTASGGESTLKVRVNDILWEETPSLFLLDERSQAYIVRHDDEGNTIITFGDGIKGVRLPTGLENITATYRSGIGPEGEVDVGSLALMQARPLGIREVTNPLPATGAEEPEKLDDARSNAPLTVLTLDRIVSIKDFEDFAATFSGIGKAQATVLWTGVTNITHITIAAANGDPVPETSALYNNLLQAIDAVRDTTVHMQIDSHVPVYFNVKARVSIDSRFIRETVEARIRNALRSAFSFEARDFGQVVTEAEVIAEIHEVEGVIAVNLTALYTGSYDPARDDVITPLPAATASWDNINSRAEPAELLLINPGPNGVTFEENEL